MRLSSFCGRLSAWSVGFVCAVCLFPLFVTSWCCAFSACCTDFHSGAAGEVCVDLFCFICDCFVRAHCAYNVTLNASAFLIQVSRACRSVCRIRPIAQRKVRCLCVCCGMHVRTPFVCRAVQQLILCPCCAVFFCCAVRLWFELTEAIFAFVTKDGNSKGDNFVQVC